MCKLSKILLFFLFFFFVSCGKEEQRIIFSFPVNFTIDLNRYDHSLRNPLAYKVFRENDRRTPTDKMGFGGLLIVSGFNDDIFAFDLACPCERRRDVIVAPTADGTAVCAACKSVFITSFGLGTVQSGVVRAPLQRYRVFPQGAGVFLVRN
jgi:hypothetical protein